jgi:hypothetical protein
MATMTKVDRERALVILNTLAASGHIEIHSGGEVTGLASDGQIVALGNVPSYPPAATKFGRDSLYRYLLSHSTPDTW